MCVCIHICTHTVRHTIEETEILATDLFEMLLEDLKKADVMSVAVDESTDKTDTTQLCIYVRFF